MSISLCLMVRNEEEALPGCLQSAADLVDEIIVVDTGSTDGTRELAGKLGARVFEFPWCDDFAAARNECIRLASQTPRSQTPVWERLSSKLCFASSHETEFREMVSQTESLGTRNLGTRSWEPGLVSGVL
jgi:hypothetical protein